MMSVSRDAKKTNNFSIEAIMARGCTTSRACACPAGPPQPPVKPPQGHPTRIGHPAACFPSHVDYARLAVARTTGIPGGPWGVGGGPVYAAAPAPPPFPADSLQAFQCQLYASAVAQHKHSTPFYNWLLARQGDYFGRALQESDEAYLFGLRKPKRVRTAFSPDQLLQLEQAFELNHYVVGQERKDLASELDLSETQVKVWFQNRRTKFKRIQTDDGEDLSITDGHAPSLTDGHAPEPPSSPEAAPTSAEQRRESPKSPEHSAMETDDDEDEFVDVLNR